jgi:hypothetical protein
VNMDGMTPGSITISGHTTRRPKVTWAVADEGMPLGQQWVVRADDDVPALRGITDIPAHEFVVIMNPADPDWLTLLDGTQ